MKRVIPVLSVALWGVLAFMATTAIAATAGNPDDSGLLADMLGKVWTAVTGKHWWLASALGLVAAVALFKKYAPAGRARDFANSDAGGASLVLAGAFGAALAASLTGASPVPMSAGLAYDALRVALTAAGGYALISRLIIGPLTSSKWYQDKAPAWLKLSLGTVLWIFSKTKTDVAAEAEKKGDEAVAAKPAEGAEGVIGKPTEL